MEPINKAEEPQEQRPEKPLKAKPMFYSMCFDSLQSIARELGYNLLLHGSLDRDMDLVAVPWVDEPSSHRELLQALDMHLRGIKYHDDHYESGYMFSMLPGGRYSYVINLDRGGPLNGYVDRQYYLDISITPLIIYHD